VGGMTFLGNRGPALVITAGGLPFRGLTPPVVTLANNTPATPLRGVWRLLFVSAFLVDLVVSTLLAYFGCDRITMVCPWVLFVLEPSPMQTRAG